MNRTGTVARVAGLGICTAIGLASLGCGGEKVPPLFPVSGTVTYQGKPVPGATVVFIPETKAAGGKKNEKPPLVVRPAADADDGGNFSLLYADKYDGAPAGKYTVVITAVEPFGENEDSEERRPNKIPEKFGNPATSGLTAVVKDDENTFNFALKD